MIRFNKCGRGIAPSTLLGYKHILYAHIGAAKKFGITNIITRVVAPSREISLPLNNLIFYLRSKKDYGAHLQLSPCAAILVQRNGEYLRNYRQYMSKSSLN